MDPLQFLAAVLPSAGYYCAVEVSSKKKTHAFVETLEELNAKVTAWSDEGVNAYYALASFTKAGSRTAANAKSIRSLFIDIDCGGDGKSYATQAEAVAALSAFLEASGMPTPWVVSSGNGVHCYWPFTEDAAIDEWKPVAENFKRLCKQHGLGIDFTVTADAARILRVPGTRNWKDPEHPKLVKIKLVGDPPQTPLAELAERVLQTLEEPVAPQQTLNVPGKRLEQSPSLVRVLENRVTFFKTIFDRTVAGEGCGQLAYYVEHAADDGMEPLWRGMLSLAKACADGEKAAKLLSGLHPYPEARMQTKLREIKGPYPCSKLDGENPGICSGCKHWGLITNPLALGHEVQTDSAEKTVEIPAQTPEDAPTMVVRPTPPYGFAYGAKGGVYRKEKALNAAGDEVVSNRLVLPYDLFVVDLLSVKDEGHIVQLMAMRPEGPVGVVIPQRSIVSKDETVKALAEQNIVAAYGAGNDKHLFDYVRGCVGEVSASRRAIDVPRTFGWQEDGTFVLNGKIYSPSGEKAVPMPHLANIIYLTTPKGTLENWKKVVQLLVNRKQHDILGMALTAFGAPLMQFSNFEALTYHIGSSNSGTGKSVSLSLAASVWGVKHYILNPKTSVLAQEHRAGSMGNLPIIVDEITEANKDFEWLSTFVMDMTGGGGKDRLHAGKNEERVNNTFWRTLFLLASNTHATDFFSGVRKKTAEGHLRRILELKMEKVLTWSPEEEETLSLMRHNYGVAGHAYVQWLVRNREIAHAVYNKVHRQLKAELKATGDERFWIAGISANIAGGILIGSNYANIIDLPMKGIIDALKDIVLKARGIVRANVRDAEDILNAYTREFYGQFIVLRLNDKTKTMETSFGNGGVTDQTITRSQIKGRVEHDIVPGHVNYYIEETQMKAWCSHMNYGYADFKKQLEKKFVVTYGKKDMLSKTRGPQMRVNVIKITRSETQNADEIEAHDPVE